jgi:hypothetical protein
MSSRRHFLKAAAAASLLPFAARTGMAATETGTTVRPWLVVADTHSAAAAAFAAEAGRWRIPVRGIDGDVTALWYEVLQPLWREQPMPIAGLTTRPALFCLERLAWDHGMRVVYHAEHTQRADGTFAHVALMPVHGLSSAELVASDKRWAAHVVSTLARLPAESAMARGPSAACTAAVLDETAAYFSWMISPVRG